MLIDEAKITVKAGKGGDGAVSFRREKFIAKGGPDGGDGGKGGDVIFECSEDVSTLSVYARIKNFKANNGMDGSSKKMSGRAGKDLILKLPPGTIISDATSGKMITELTSKGDTFVIQKGGKGGLGNVHFKSSTHQAPREFKPGEKIEPMPLSLELKIIADVGLIGLPNSGKSTLLSIISNATPKVAAYPFTTIEPVLGKVTHKGEDFVVADIPGLIEGASQGKGLGHKFLRHIGRTKMLVHMIDAGSTDPEQDYKTIRLELKEHDKELLKKDEIIVISKTDQSVELPKDFKYDIALSAVTNNNIDLLLDKIISKL